MILVVNMDNEPIGFVNASPMPGHQWLKIPVPPSLEDVEIGEHTAVVHEAQHVVSFDVVPVHSKRKDGPLRRGVYVKVTGNVHLLGDLHKDTFIFLAESNAVAEG